MQNARLSKEDLLKSDIETMDVIRFSYRGEWTDYILSDL